MASYLSERELRIRRRERIRNEEEQQRLERSLDEQDQSLLTIDQMNFESDNEERKSNQSTEISKEINRLDEMIKTMSEEQAYINEHDIRQMNMERELNDQRYEEKKYENDELLQSELEINERERKLIKEKVKREMEELTLRDMRMKEIDRVQLDNKRVKELELRGRENEKYKSQREVEIVKNRLEKERLDKEIKEMEIYKMRLKQSEFKHEQREMESRDLEKTYRDREIERSKIYISNNPMIRKECDKQSGNGEIKKGTTEYESDSYLDNNQYDCEKRNKHNRMRHVTQERYRINEYDMPSVANDYKETMEGYLKYEDEHLGRIGHVSRDKENTLRYGQQNRMPVEEYDSRSRNTEYRGELHECEKYGNAIESRMKNLETNIRKEIETELRKEITEQIRKESEEKYRLKEMAKALRKQELRKRKMKEEQDLIKSIERLQMQNEVHGYESDSEISEDEEAKIMNERIQMLKAQKDRLEIKMKMKSSSGLSRKEEKVSGKPIIPKFDGHLFEEWKLEVKSVIESEMYSEFTISQTIRNSLVGTTRKILLTLKPSATAREIMDKLEDIYGNLRSGDSIIHEFYSAKQSTKETSSEWGLRLETLFYQALERKEIDESRKDTKLKERFWRGLYSEKIKTAIRTTYESNASFNILRKKARIEELELEMIKDNNVENTKTKDGSLNTDKLKVCQPVQEPSITNSKIEELLRKMTNLEKEMREIKRIQTTKEREIPRDNFQSNRQFRRRRRFQNTNRGQIDDDIETDRPNNQSRGQNEHKKKIEDNKDLNY